jgi:hypothetical protein
MEFASASSEEIDILSGNPLQRAVNVQVETNILEPVSFQYNNVTGGVARFVLPARGVLNAPTASLNFEIYNGNADKSGGVDLNLAFPLDCGGIAMIDRVVARCGGQVITRLDGVALYHIIKNKFKSQPFRYNVLDVRHCSMSGADMRVQANPPEAFGAFVTGGTTLAYHQIQNPAIDQSAAFGDYPFGAPNNVQHIKPRNKCLRAGAGAGTGPEVAIRLADIIPFFVKNQLPLLAMAQVELEFHFRGGPAAATAYQNINDAPIVANDPQAGGLGASTGHQINFASPPFLSLDYLHYDESEQEKIMDQVKSGEIRMNFTEVVRTQGINPEYTGGVNGTHPISSNHIIGMAGKEVKKIYVCKSWDIQSASGDAEKNNLLAGAQVHRNIQLWNYKSVAMLGEKYNFIINNERVYNSDVELGATQHRYMSECEGHWQCLPGQYDTNNFNQSVVNVLNNARDDGVPNTNNNAGKTAVFLGGCSHVIGINLDKYNEFGNTPGNGTRIGSSPIEFNYTCNKVESGVGGEVNKAAVNLTFYIEHRRSLIINQLGVSVSDA